MTKDRWSNVLFAGVLFLLVAIPFYKVGFPLWIGVALSAIGAIGLASTGNRSKKPGPFVYFVSAFFLMELIWLVFAPDQVNAIKNILLKSSLLILPWSLLAVDHGFNKAHFHLLFGVFLVSSIVSGMSHLILAFQNSLEKESLMIYYQDLSQWVHPGYYGILIAIAIIVGVFVQFNRTGSIRFISKWIKPVGVLFLIVILFLLSARMQLIAMMLIFFFTGTALLIKKLGKRKASVYSIVLLAIVAMASTLAFKYNHRINHLYSEFEHASTDSSKHLNSVETRIVLWQIGLETVLEKPFLGHGTASTKGIMVEKAAQRGHAGIVAQNMGVHNEFLDAWITKGIAGILLLLIIIGQPLIHALRNHNLFLASILILFGLTFLTESALEREMGVILFATFVPLTMLYHLSETNVGD